MEIKAGSPNRPVVLRDEDQGWSVTWEDDSGPKMFRSDATYPIQAIREALTAARVGDAPKSVQKTLARMEAIRAIRDIEYRLRNPPPPPEEKASAGAALDQAYSLASALGYHMVIKKY
ncbi:MAG: hypothetical protein LAT68_16505 [Cyclobacteriaceae bacterium]|nr:hypothetical protein [Cyclobacteriaceae bacterium]